MLSDNYCIALLVLVLFFMYVDNVNNIEGYAELSELDAGYAAAPVAPGAPVTTEGVPATRKQDLVGVGMKPQKVDMKPTASMSNDFMAVTTMPDNLAPLDQAFAILSPQDIPTQIPSDLKSLGSRVGGTGNMGDPALGGLGGPMPSGSMPSGSMVAPSQGPTESKDQAPSKKLEVHMVYAPWCGWSKKALPDFKAVKDEYHGKVMGDYAVEVHMHDSDTPAGKDMAKKHNVKGFPTHFLLNDGEKVEAAGRSKDQLASQIKEITA